MSTKIYPENITLDQPEAWVYGFFTALGGQCEDVVSTLILPDDFYNLSAKVVSHGNVSLNQEIGVSYNFLANGTGEYNITINWTTSNRGSSEDTLNQKIISAGELVIKTIEGEGMLSDIYILLCAFAMVTGIIGLTIKREDGSSPLFLSMISAITFFVVALYSFQIEKVATGVLYEATYTWIGFLWFGVGIVMAIHVGHEMMKG
jgi:hypothetical protein